MCRPISSEAGRRHLRSADHGQLIVPHYRLTTAGRRAFSCAGPSAWNSLPALLRDETLSLDSFKRCLKCFLLATYWHSAWSALEIFNDIVLYKCSADKRTLTKPSTKTFLQTGGDDLVDLDSPGWLPYTEICGNLILAWTTFLNLLPIVYYGGGWFMVLCTTLVHATDDDINSHLIIIIIIINSGMTYPSGDWDAASWLLARFWGRLL